MDAQIITIGDEILIGQIIDTNSAWMAQQLNLQGIRIAKINSISDTHEAIVQAVDLAFAETDIILVTGGLGPTKDDITKKALADYFGTGMYFHEATYNRLQRIFAKWGRSMTDAHREQCYMPENATILTNKMGSAPGMWFEKNGKVLVSMPGVPYEMKYLMEYEVLPKVKTNFPGQPIAHRTILTVGEGESRIAKQLEDFENDLPVNIKLAYLPSLGTVRLRLSATGPDQAKIETLLDEKVKVIQGILPEFIFGYGTQQLEDVIGMMLKKRGKSLATAESCTGGYVAHRITAIPGSSSYFMGSVIAYSNEVKMNQLQVLPETLEKHGAVSEQTVIEMAKGALNLLKTDLSVAISGIAGPGGGTPEKPVGTIWLAVASEDKVDTLKLQLGKSRLKNIEYTSTAALNMIRKFLLE